MSAHTPRHQSRNGFFVSLDHHTHRRDVERELDGGAVDARVVRRYRRRRFQREPVRVERVLVQAHGAIGTALQRLERAPDDVQVVFVHGERRVRNKQRSVVHSRRFRSRVAPAHVRRDARPRLAKRARHERRAAARDVSPEREVLDGVGHVHQLGVDGVKSGVRRDVDGAERVHANGTVDDASRGSNRAAQSAPSAGGGGGAALRRRRARSALVVVVGALVPGVRFRQGLVQRLAHVRGDILRAPRPAWYASNWSWRGCVRDASGSSSSRQARAPPR